MADNGATIRVDRWLWFARFFKTRGLASKLVRGGHLRVNAHKITKPAHLVRAGDTLTFAAGRRVRVVRILRLGSRRGPAPEAQMLYEEIGAPAPARDEGKGPAKARAGARPTKRERRQMERSRRDMLD